MLKIFLYLYMDNKDVRKLLKEIGFYEHDKHSRREIYVYSDSRFPGDHAVYLSFNGDIDTGITNFKIFHRYTIKGSYTPHVIKETKSVEKAIKFLLGRFSYKLRDDRINFILS